MRIQDTHSAVVVLLLVLTAGCTGGLTGGSSEGGTLSFSAAPIHVSDEAVSQTEFTAVTNEPISFEETFEVAGQSQKVEMNAHMAQLERTYKGAPLGTMVVLSVPQIRILGQQIDVIERLNTTSLIERAQGSSSDIQTQKKVDEFSVTALDGQRTVEVFRGTSEQNGAETKVRIYVTTFDYEGDTIVGVAIVPQSVDSERGAIKTLFGGIRYG
jgi:predicted transcriptional regulator